MKKLFLLIAAAVFPLMASAGISASISPSTILAGEEARISVFTTDDKGNMVKGITVKFTVITGGGTVSPSQETSDLSGTIKAVLKSGPNPGINSVKVESQGASPVILSVNAKASPPFEFSMTAEPLKLNPGQTAAVEVEVKNEQGGMVAGAPVTFVPGDLFTVEPKQAKTSVNGKAKAVVKAGRKAGLSKLEVRIENLDSQFAEFEIMETKPKDIVLTASPTGLNIKSRSTIKAKITDNIGGAVPDIPVNFEIADGDATLDNTRSKTDKNGEAKVMLTSGTKAGPVSVKASAEGFSPVEVRLMISFTQLPPAQLKAEADVTETVAGDEVTITATVLDREKKLVTGPECVFDIESGDGKLTSQNVPTEGGKASTKLLTSDKPGVNTVRVRVGNLPVVRVKVTTLGELKYSAERPGEASKIYLNALPRSLSSGESSNISAIVTDKNNVPVPGAEVKFEIRSGAGTLSEETAVTDQNGNAAVTLTSSQAGAVKVNAKLSGGASSSIAFQYKYPVWYFLGAFALVLLLLGGFYLLSYGSVRKRNPNPVTGFPSDLYLKWQVRKRLDARKKFAAIFVDLDRFNTFAMLYGPKKTDELIKALGNILRKVTNKDDQIVHLNGDDFVILTDLKRAYGVAQGISSHFERESKQHYSEEDLKNNCMTVREKEGAVFNVPLMSVSIGILDTKSIPIRTFNEFLEAGGKLIKSSKAKSEDRIVRRIDDDSEKGEKKYRIGWFTMLLAAGVFFTAATAGAQSDFINRKLSASADKDLTVAGGSAVITAKFIDNKGRPISGAQVVFHVEDGNGGLENAFAFTDKDGTCSTVLKTGKKPGDNTVRVFCGKASAAKITVKGYINIADYLVYVVAAACLFFAFVIFSKFLHLRYLLKGIDMDVKMTTRPFAERRITRMLASGKKFHVMAIEYRDFSGFNKEYGFEQGKKAVKALADSIKSTLKEIDPTAGAYYFGADRFVIVTTNEPANIAQDVIGEMEVLIPILCDDKGGNYFLLHQLIGIGSHEPGAPKSVAEIMNLAGKGLRDAKNSPGSSFAQGF